MELSDHGDDFASSVGVGAVISTKFTWPKDTDHPVEKLPPGGYVLTPAKEALWRKWVHLYKTHMLPKGEYLGSLYDIGFDKPEAHAISKDGAMYYAFYADKGKRWSGEIELRGLKAGTYRVFDYENGRQLGSVDASTPKLKVDFLEHLLIEVSPAGEKN